MHMSVQNVSIISNTCSNKSNSSGVEHSNKQRANFKTNYIDNNNNDKNEKYNYGCGDNNNNSKSKKIKNNNKYKERVAHHRNSYDSSSFNNKVTTTTTTTTTNTTTPITNKTNNNNNNNNNKAIPIKIPIKKTYKNNLPASNCCNNNNININKATSINLSPNLANSKTRDDLIEQFENLKSKAEYFADKDPDFTARLLNFANKITSAYQLHSAGDLFTCGMESSYYSNAYNNHHHTRYSHPSIYSSHSTYHTQPSNIYSTFNSTVFYNNHHSGTSHSHRTHPAPPPPPPPPPPQAQQCSSSAPSSPQPSTATSSQPQQSSSSQQNSANTNGTSSRSSNSKNHSDSSNFKRYSTNGTNHSKNYKDDHSYSRYNAYNTYPNHHYSSTNSSSRYNDPSTFHNNIYTSHYYQHYSQSEHTPFIYSYHNQDGPEDIFLILEDTYDPNKLIVQMTRTHLGPNGEQQRVTVERDFRNEMELNAFLKEFEENLHKTSKQNQTTQASNTKVNHSTSDEYIKAPGVVVVEEPGEEPKLYRQDTGELVTPTNSSYIDPVIHEENDEHPNELPKGKEKAKYPSSHSKLYKDIDELIENLITEDQNLKSKTFQAKPDKENASNANVYTKQQKEKEKIQKRYSFPPRDDTKDQHANFKKSFHQTTAHFETKSSSASDPKPYFSSATSNESKRPVDTFSSSKSEKLNKETSSKNTDLISDHSSPKSQPNSKTIDSNITTAAGSNISASNSSKKQTDSVTQRLIMSNHKLNKKEYTNTANNCHRSSSTRSTLNEKDLKKPTRLPEKLKKTLKDSPLLSKSPTNGAHRYASGKENKEKLFSSKLKSHDSESYNHNRVSFSFQPTTEYLQHFRNVGLTKLGAASSLKPKDVPIYQRAHLPRSQSVITCHQNLGDATDFVSKLDELNEIDNKENTENVRYSQHYAKFDSDTTVEENTTSTSFKEKEVSIKSISDIKKTYKKIKNSLNVPKNISKSVEMISKKTSSDLKKNLDPKKNLAKINEYFSSNNQLSASKSNKKLNEQTPKNAQKNTIKIIKPTPLTPPTVSTKIDKSSKQPDDETSISKTKKSLIADKVVKKKTIKIEKNNKYSARDEFPDIDDSDANDDDELLTTENNTNSKLDSKLNEKEDDYDINETDEYEDDDSEDQTSYDYYKSYNSEKNNYHYDTSNLYSRQSDIYNSYRSHPSPAFFQPGFYPRSGAPQPDLIQSSNSQNLFSQHHHHHMQYHQPYFSKQSSYYGSWYGSTPSLRVPVRNQNRQSSYFN